MFRRGIYTLLWRALAMLMYVSVTDIDMFEFLKEKNCSEVNFWRPGAQAFRALFEDELFLFKLHAPDNYIVGGGFFGGYSYMPAFLAWDAFGEKNGKASLVELNRAIKRYRNKQKITSDESKIGCVLLKDVFYLDRENWIPTPDDFSSSIVTGKLYDTEISTGKAIYKKLKKCVPEVLSRSHALEEGAFRILTTDAYARRCAITGERTLPVLEATHIKPIADGGTHSVDNGILLKSDLRALFDSGYITIDTDLVVHVSRRLRADYGGGEEYERYDGKELLILPDLFTQYPDREALRWHNENVYLG